MDQVNKLIFNALVSREGVNIPGMGALVIEKRPAQLKGRKKLLPPRSTVRYREGSVEGLPTVPELIDAVVKDPQRSQAIYDEWLAAQGVTPERIPSTIVLEGIGDIIYQAFNASAALEKALNPVPTAETQLTPRVKAKHVALVLGCVLIVGAAVALYLRRSPEQQQHAYAKRMARELEQRNLERAQRGLDVVRTDQLPPEQQAAMSNTPQAQPADTITPLAPEAVPEGKPVETKPVETKPVEEKPAAKPAEPAKPAETAKPAQTSQPAAKPATQPAAAQPAGPTYHLVLGVFSNQENADKFISLAADPATKFTVVPFSGGKLIVSGFSSANQAEVNAAKAKFAAKYPDAWIYKKK